MSNIFTPAINTDTVQDDINHLGFQLAVAQEIQQCPKLLAYITQQAEQAAYDLLNLDSLSSRDSTNVHVNLAHAKGTIDAYKHLYELVTKADQINQDFILKTRGE